MICRIGSYNEAVMDMKYRLTIGFCAICLLLCACSPVINSEKDEIRLYEWIGEYNNGNSADLRFDGSDACLTVKNSDFSFDIEGLCSLKDDSFLIFDSESGMNYTFGYVLHGDCIELSYNGDTIVLEKKVEE